MEYGRLLSLLKSGELKSGFLTPLQGETLWIPLSTEYWATVTSDKFKVIRSSKTKPASGAFKLSLRDVASSVVAQVIEHTHDSAVATDTWTAVLAATARKYEVEILEESWNEYERANPPVPHLPSTIHAGRVKSSVA